jgi:hypothetical protein
MYDTTRYDTSIYRCILTAAAWRGNIQSLHAVLYSVVRVVAHAALCVLWRHAPGQACVKQVLSAVFLCLLDFCPSKPHTLKFPQLFCCPAVLYITSSLPVSQHNLLIHYLSPPSPLRHTLQYCATRCLYAVVLGRSAQAAEERWSVRFYRTKTSSVTSRGSEARSTTLSHAESSY